MRGQRFWYRNGRVIVENDSMQSEDVSVLTFAKRGDVRVVTGPKGTEIKWVLDAPNHLNLAMIAQTLAEHSGPFLLRYYSAGWFEESFETVERAVWRIEDLMLHGDRCLGRRTFVRESVPNLELMPPILRETWRTGVPNIETMIECRFQPEQQHFVVERVGARTPIGRIWGTGASSGPCIPLGPFDASVSKTYEEVLQAGVPRYDQVIASFMFPDKEIRWVPYHRLVLPQGNSTSQNASVLVITEIASVNFSVI